MEYKPNNILFINACVREDSRTARLAKAVLRQIPGTVTEVRPDQVSEPVRNEQFLLQRGEDTATGSFEDPRYEPARQFAAADIIVIAAPYWDLSFPAVLKAYFEQCNVVGLTFEYTEEGIPRSLCRAQKLIYVTTAGGPIISDEFGFGYVKTLASMFYGIPEIRQLKAEGLDVIGADVEKILQEALDAFDPGAEGALS